MNPFDTLLACPGFPDFNPMMLLHAEQKIEIHEPLKIGTDLKNTGKISGIVDKGKMTLVVFTMVSSCEKTSKKIFTNTMSLIIRGVGGFGANTIPGMTLPPTIPKIPTQGGVKKLVQTFPN